MKKKKLFISANLIKTVMDEMLNCKAQWPPNLVLLGAVGVV